VLQRCVELTKTSGVARISEWGWDLASLGMDRNPQLPEAIGCLGDSPPEARRSGNGAPALGDFCGDFCNFLIKITYFYAYFGQNRYFKAIIHQLKAFKISLNVLNSINKLQVLYYSFKCY